MTSLRSPIYHWARPKTRDLVLNRCVLTWPPLVEPCHALPSTPSLISHHILSSSSSSSLSSSSLLSSHVMSLTTISYKYLIMMAQVKMMIIQKTHCIKNERVWMTACGMRMAHSGETIAERIPPKKIKEGNYHQNVVWGNLSCKVPPRP